MDQEHTLSVFTENRVGLLGRVTATLSRRGLNIESLTVSESEVPGIHRFTIVLHTSAEQARKVAAVIERQVDVLKAFVYEAGQLVERDLALYKVDARGLGADFDTLVAEYGARVLERSATIVVVEHTGSERDTSRLLHALQPYGVLEFARSGKVAITRPLRPLLSYIEEIEQSRATG